MLALGPTSALAVSFEAGDWTVSIGGNINAHYVYVNCETDESVSGGLANLGCNGNDDDIHAVQNGLLPTALVFGLSTTQAGFDLGATVGLYPGTVGSTAIVDSSTLDVRQTFMTVGNADIGTFKAGRDFGIFGWDGIINDMSIPGVGPVFSAATPANTSLGGIGFGYIYVDRLSQINWTSPDLNGFEVTFGIYSPIDTLNLSGAASIPTGVDTGSETPGFHGKLKYGWEGGFVSVAGLTQSFDNDNFDGMGTDIDYQAYGVDFYGMVTYGPWGLSGYYYTANGLGTTGLFTDAVATNGNERDSDGGYLQGTYKFGNTKVGAKYGVSNLDLANGEATSDLVETNDAITLGVYHNLTPNLLLVGEYTHAESEAHNGNQSENDSVNVGAFLSF